jgi:hypothetical protein
MCQFIASLMRRLKLLFFFLSFVGFASIKAGSSRTAAAAAVAAAARLQMVVVTLFRLLC